MRQGMVRTFELVLALRYLEAVAKHARLVKTPGTGRLDQCQSRWVMVTIESDGLHPVLQPCERATSLLLPPDDGPPMPVHHWDRLRNSGSEVAERYKQLLWALGASDTDTYWSISHVVGLLEPAEARNTPQHLRDPYRDARHRTFYRLLNALGMGELAASDLRRH